MLRIFVYGTLVRGGEFHDAFCRGALSIAKASVRGRLDRSGRYLVLSVLEADILATGTADVGKDLDLQARHAVSVEGSDIFDQAWDMTGWPVTRATPAAWGWVAGELITLDDAFARLLALDRLEGFRPEARSLYRRVLLPVRLEKMAGVASAWTYVG